MTVNIKALKAQYKSDDIQYIWSNSHGLRVIQHPEIGLISPDEYRARYKGSPCPMCGELMVHGWEHKTKSRSEAKSRGYEYIDENGKKTINSAGNNTYFHPHYVSIDHIVNKARCPELMFEASNLQAVCWKCNSAKGQDNAYEIKKIRSKIAEIRNQALAKYKPT